MPAQKVSWRTLLCGRRFDSIKVKVWLNLLLLGLFFQEQMALYHRRLGDKEFNLFSSELSRKLLLFSAVKKIISCFGGRSVLVWIKTQESLHPARCPATLYTWEFFG